MKSQFTYDRTGNNPVDRAFDRVALAFSRVDSEGNAIVTPVNAGGDFRAVGNEALIVVSVPARVLLPTPTKPWDVTVVQTCKGTVTIQPSSPTVALDGKTPGSVALDEPFQSARIVTDGKAYYLVGGSASAPPVPPIPPFPPGPPFPPPPLPPPAVIPWVAPLNFGSTLVGDTSGAETWQAEFVVNFTGAPSVPTLYWWFQALSSAGTGVFNVRVGGSAYKALDGAIVATWSETSPTFAERNVTAAVFAPSGNQRVTLTAQASTAGAKAQIQAANGRFV